MAESEAGEWPPLAIPVPRRFGPGWRVSVSDLEAALGEVALGESWFSNAGRSTTGFEEHVPPASGPRRGAATNVDAEQLGTLVHAALELVELRPRTSGATIDIDALVTAAWGRSDKPLSDALRAEAVEQTERWIGSPLWHDISRAELPQREIPFLLARPAPVALSGLSPRWTDVERVAVSGTIDLLYRRAAGTSECWRIVDYKTSGPVTADEVPKMLARYELQLGLYCLAVEKWIGLLPERVSLILLRGAVQEVYFEPTREFLDHTARLCERAIMAAAGQTERDAEDMPSA